MDSVKSTNELISELREVSSFSQYAETNEEGFLQALSETEGTCPYCGAELFRGASYCTSCMRSLLERKIIPVRRKSTGKPRRVLLTVLAICVLLALLGGAFGLFILPLLDQKPALALPSEEEFRVLAAGASEEGMRQIWSQEAFVLKEQKNGYSIYETETALSETPFRIAFSDDGKRLFAALTDLSPDSAENSLKLAETLFSAVYRYYPENAGEILTKEEYFTAKTGPGETFGMLLAAIGTDLPAGEEILESLPIVADRYGKAPSVRVWKTGAGGSTGLFLLFEEAAP